MTEKNLKISKNNCNRKKYISGSLEIRDFVLSRIKSQKKPYTITISQKTLKISTDNETWVLRKNYIGRGALGIFSMVKSDIRKNIKGLTVPTSYPKYIDINFDKFCESANKIEKIIEIDISQCYLNIAKQMGMISDRVYNKLRSVSKSIRLISMGNIASVKLKYYYDSNSKMIKTERVADQQMINTWRFICFTTDMFMDELKKIAGKYFLMYWVDGLYILYAPNVALLIKNKIETAGFHCKLKELNLQWNFQNGRLNFSKDGLNFWAVPYRFLKEN